MELNSTSGPTPHVTIPTTSLVIPTPVASVPVLVAAPVVTPTGVAAPIPVLSPSTISK